METFNNHLCYVILFENHQHGGTHGMTNRLRGYTRQKRLGNTALVDNMKMDMQSSNFNLHFHILVWPFYDHIKITMEKPSTGKTFNFQSRTTL